MERKLGALKNGRVFNYAGVNWVKLDDLNGGALVLSADSLFRRAFDTEGKNNFAVSSLNRELNGDFLEALCREGAKKEDFVPLVLDLTSDDGMKDYGVTSAMIGLLTCEQFRKYRALIPNLNEEDWWWLLTPDSCLPQYGHLVRGVGTDGALGLLERFRRQRGRASALYPEIWNLGICGAGAGRRARRRNGKAGERSHWQDQGRFGRAFPGSPRAGRKRGAERICAGCRGRNVSFHVWH